MKFLSSTLLLLLPSMTLGFGALRPPFVTTSSSSSLSSRATSSSLQALPVGVFFGTSTGSTESAAELLAAAFGAPAPTDIDLVEPASLAKEFDKYDALVVGTPTWNTGADTERSGTGWDEVYYTTEMQTLSSLKGKKVAVFGMGDSVSYAENYADATGELYDVFKARGCQMLGFTSQEGYEHEDSKAILPENNDLFCGLLLDNVNFEELTEPRIAAWVEQLKTEGILEQEAAGAAEASDATDAVPGVVATPLEEPVVAATTTTSTSSNASMLEIIAKLEQENAALKEQLLRDNNDAADDPEIVMSGSDGYQPHYNANTGRTMWTSPDGRTCYYTEVKSSSAKTMSP